MRIAALSDFHIGPTDDSDVFRHELPAFMATLDAIERDHDHIVLLGDIFQAQHGIGFGAASQARELDRARKRVPALWERMRSVGYTYIHGNHDAVARECLGAQSSVRFESDGVAVFLTHGHQFDPFLRRIYALTRVGTWMTGRMRVLGLRAAADRLEHEDVVRKRDLFCGPHGPYARGAVRLLRDQRADIVVMGHTHVPARLELPGGIMANTGTCSLGQTMFASIDTARPEATVEVWDKPDRRTAR